MTDIVDPNSDEFDPAIDKLSKDLRRAAQSLGDREARYLVDRYYQSQDDRKRADNQTRATNEAGEPSKVISWLATQSETLENRIKSMLNIYSNHNPLGKWARSNKGIGPVIAAGLLAHIDINKAPTAGHIWSFAGLDPRVVWMAADETSKHLAEHLGGKPKTIDNEVVIKACNLFRRKIVTIERYAKDEETGAITWTSLCKALARKPWNSDLKVLQWKIGESFVKVQGYEDAYYGKLYTQYRLEEDKENSAGNYVEQAKKKLEKFNIGKATEAYGHYNSGHLPPAHLYARSKRRVVKLFLSHYHQVGYELLHKKPAPRPYAIEYGGHAHYIPPPNWTSPT